MITAEQFIKTHRATAQRADWLESLAIAAELVLEGNGLTNKDIRKKIALDILGASQFLAKDLSTVTGALSDRAEYESLQEKIGGAA